MTTSADPPETDVRVTLAAQQEQLDDLAAAVEALQRAVAALDARLAAQDSPPSGGER